MAKLFQELKRHDKFPFEVVFLVMDPGSNPENRRAIADNARILSVPITILDSEPLDSVFKSMLYLRSHEARIPLQQGERAWLQ